MKKVRVIPFITLCIVCAFFMFGLPLLQTRGATVVSSIQSLIFPAVDATPLDGATAGRTFQATDRNNDQCITLTGNTDAINVIAWAEGADGDSAIFNVYLYGPTGAAQRVFHTVTATLGTATQSLSAKYVESFVGTDTHAPGVGISDSGTNTVCSFRLDVEGAQWVKFEPVTFTALTRITFEVRSFGYE